MQDQNFTTARGQVSAVQTTSTEWGVFTRESQYLGAIQYEDGTFVAYPRGHHTPTSHASLENAARYLGEN